jgi:hypothetical protein
MDELVGEWVWALAAACVVMWVVVTAARERPPRANRRRLSQDVDATL